MNIAKLTAYLIKYLPHIAIIIIILGFMAKLYNRGYQAGKNDIEQQHTINIVRQLEEQQDSFNEFITRYEQDAMTFATERAKQQQTIKNIEKRVSDYVKNTANDCHLNDDGVQLINDIIRAANGQ